MRAFTSRLTLIAFTTSLGACVAGPPPEIATPAPDLPGAYFFAPPETTSAALDQLLPSDDPAFTALSNSALDGAPSLAEALARIDAARAGARGAGARRLPLISGDATVTGTRINPNQFGDGAGGFIDTEQLQYGANLVASWDTDLFGVLRARERAAIARIDAASASANAVRLALISEIATSVIDWRTLSARETELQSDVAAASQLAGLAKTREDAGLSPGFDRVRAEAAASASRSRLAALENERAQIIGRLVALTGQTAGEVNQALSVSVPLAEQRPAAPASLPSQLLANRPDVLAATAELAATDADLAATARQRFPQLTLSGALGLLAFNIGDLFDEESVVGSLAGGLAAPLIDFGRIEAEIDGAAANKRAAFAAYRGAVFQALGEAETAYGLIEAIDRQADLAAQERDELQRAARLADTRYRAGLADFLTVLEARRAADASGERAAIASGQAQRARVLLWQALGGAPSQEPRG